MPQQCDLQSRHHFLLRTNVGRTDRLASPVSQSSAVFGQSGQSRFKIELHPDIDTEKDTQRETDTSKKGMKKKINQKKKQGERDASKMVSVFTSRLNVLNGQLVCSDLTVSTLMIRLTGTSVA